MWLICFYLYKNIAKLADEIGLSITELQKQLEQESLKAEIEKDKVLASKIGINSVPFFIINDHYTVSGAQSPEHFLKALNEAYKL